MYLTGKFQARKLTKREKDGTVYRNLWITDESGDDYQISFDVSLLSVLKKDAFYEGIFEIRQFAKFQGYGVDNSLKLVDCRELEKGFEISGGWQV